MSRPLDHRTRVISISLPQRLLDRVNACEAHEGFRGRSEVFRAGLDLLLRRLEHEGDWQGPLTATLTIVFEHEATPDVARVRHGHEGLVKSLLHSHTDDGRCLEILVLAGPGESIRRLANSLRGLPGIDLVELVEVPTPIPAAAQP